MRSPRLVAGFLVVLLSIVTFEETSAAESFWSGVKKELGGKNFVELNNGNTVRVSYIKKTIDDVQTRKPTLEQLSSNEQAVFQYLWDLMGSKYVYLTSEWGTGKHGSMKEISSWQEFFRYIRGLPVEPDEKKDTTGDKVTPTPATPRSKRYVTFWNDVKERLGETFTVKLSNGKTVNIDFLKMTIDNINMNKTAEQLKSEEKAVVRALFESLDEGWEYTLRNKTITTWQEFYEYLQIIYGKNLTVIEALEKQLKGRTSVVLGNGDSVPVKYVISVIRDLQSNPKPLSELDSDGQEILKFVFNVIGADFRIRADGKKINTWEEFYNYLHAGANHQP